MKIAITPGSISYPELEEKLSQHFPNYEFNMRGKQFLVGKKSNTVGANIIIRKNKILVAGNFPTVGGAILFSLCLVLLGILIPLIVYFSVFHKKMKALETEIGDYLKAEYTEI